LLQPDEGAANRQQERLERRLATRDNGAVRRALVALAAAAKSDTNLMPSIIEAVQAYATVGEISNVLRAQFGEYRPTVL
jgi:methylmalonyl-CoA mutase N-terminal domain/subunit